MNQQEELLRLQKLVAEQQKEIEKLRAQNENLTQAVLHAQKKIFGSSSESTRQVEGQMSMFAEAHLVESLRKLRRHLRYQRTRDNRDNRVSEKRCLRISLQK